MLKFTYNKNIQDSILVYIDNLSFIHSGKSSITKTYKIPLVHIYNLSFIHSGKSSIAGNILRCRYSIEDLSGEYDTVYKEYKQHGRSSYHYIDLLCKFPDICIFHKCNILTY